MLTKAEIAESIRRARQTFPKAAARQTGTSTLRNLVGFPDKTQREIWEEFAIREQNVNNDLVNAKNKVLESPDDPSALARLKEAQREKRNLLVDKYTYRVAGLFGDYVSDGSRQDWWLINAAQAIAGLGGRLVMKAEGYGPLGQAIGATGLALGMELASGNIDPTNLGEAGRPKGYSVLFPKEIEQVNPETGETEIVLDRTKSNNPAAELAARYFLNRTGRILPEEEFLKERPDVTPEEYARFRDAKNSKTFFGIENMPVYTSAPIGAIGGSLIAGAGGRNRMAGALLGGIAAPLSKEVFVDVPTSLGILHGTTETPDDPVGEVEFLGYRIPFKAIAASALLGAGLKYGGRALKRRNTLKEGQLAIDLDSLNQGGEIKYNVELPGESKGIPGRSHLGVFDNHYALDSYLEKRPDSNELRIAQSGGKYYVYKDKPTIRQNWMRDREEF